MRAGQRRACLDIAGIRAGLGFGQRERGELFAAGERREPTALLFVRAEQHERSQADGMMCVDEDRRGRAPAADLFHHPAIRHLRRPAAPEGFRGGHAEHPESTEAGNDFARDGSLPVDGGRIELLVEKPANLGQRLNDRHLGIRNHPICDETPQEQTLGHANSLWAGKEQFFRCLHVGCLHGRTKYTSRTDQVHLRRNLAFTFMPMRMLSRSTPMRRERNRVSTPSNSTRINVNGTSFKNSSAAK